MRKPFFAIANNKGADQPAHPRSLISAFVFRCLDGIIPLASISEISSLYLASVAAQAGLCLLWSQTPKTGFLVTRLIYMYMMIPDSVLLILFTSSGSFMQHCSNSSSFIPKDQN